MVLPYLQKYEGWIYGLLGIVAIFYLQKLILAWKDWQGTVFGLEREVAQRRFSTALTILLLLVLFVFMEFVIVSFVVPSYPQSLSLPTPTLDLLATPTATLPGLIGAANTVLTEEVVATEDLVTLEEGCIAGQIEWLSPKPGDVISATVELIGTVNVPNLGFFKYQYATPGEDLWTDIAAGNQPKVDGQIGFWNTSQLNAGDYHLRLVVYDNQNEPFPACIIPVRVRRP